MAVEVLTGVDAVQEAVLARADAAERAGLTPKFRILGYAHAGVRPEVMGIGPIPAVEALLARTGLKAGDFDVIESNEAFAAQALCTMKAWEDETFCKDKLGLDAPLGSIDRSKLNVNGSSVATGHPFAATGPRIIATLAKLLEQKGGGRGLVSICAAGGQGVTAILER